MKNTLKLITVISLSALLLISCGAPGAKSAKTMDYQASANEILALTESLPQDITDADARRFLAGVQKIMQPASDKKAINDLVVVPVNVKSTQAEYIAQKVQYLGNITGDPSIVVYPKLTDTVLEIHVKNGDFVQKGDVLARINDATVRASKSQALAAFLSAKSQVANVNVEYERTKNLYNAKAISDSQWDQIVTQREVAKAGLKQAEAALEMAETQLAYANITAPISGYVSNLAYEPGDMSTPQKPFATIHQIATIKISMNVTEKDLGSLEVGQRSEIFVSAYPNKIFEGRVATVSPVIDPMTRTAKIEIIADNADMKLKPGMFARISVIIAEKENVLTIDKAATQKQTVLKRVGDNLRDDEVVEAYSCFIVRDGVAKLVSIKVGLESKTKYEVIEGLELGDKFVVMGQNNLSDSTLVNVVE